MRRNWQRMKAMIGNNTVVSTPPTSAGVFSPATNAPPQVASVSALGAVTTRFALEDHTHALTDTAPASGDMAYYNGTHWSKLTPATISVYQYRWNSSAGQLEERSKSVKVVEDGSFGGWSDIGTYSDCT
jgi:hypothetical protein